MAGAEERITDAELEIMNELWRGDGPLTLAAIRSGLAGRLDWTGETVKTLLRRLCAKGAVGQERREVYYYRPLVSREDYECYRTGALIDQLYAGSARELVAALVSQERLGEEDVRELRALFDSLWEKKGEERE